MSITCSTLLFLTLFRPKFPKCTVSVFTVPLIEYPKHTVPTGFSLVPPVGPAIHVMPTPTFAPAVFATPLAIS